MVNGSFKLAFVGDLMLGRGVSALLRSGRSPDSFWGSSLPILRAADAVIANLESPITESEFPWDCGWKAFRFKAMPETIDILRAGNVRFVCLANNHTLDYSELGLIDTIHHLDLAGIARAGAGSSLSEALQPAIFAVGAHRIGAIAFTDGMPEFAARQGRPGTNVIGVRSDNVTLGLLQQLIWNTRLRGAGTVILSVHWGPNLRPWPPRRFRQFARAAIELGVDVVHGHSAHLFHGVEAYRGGLILYDTGDYLDDYWVFPFIRTDRSFAFLVEFDHGRPSRLEMYPVKIMPGHTELATADDFTATTRVMQRRCRALGTQLTVTPSSLTLPVPQLSVASLAHQPLRSVSCGSKIPAF